MKQIEEDAIAVKLSDSDLVSLQNEATKKCDSYLSELDDMFSQLDIRRKVRFAIWPDFLVLSRFFDEFETTKSQRSLTLFFCCEQKRDIPDYLCGKISFEIMKDPVITPR